MAGRWLKGLGGSATIADAARTAAELRLGDVARAARALDRSTSERKRAGAVHFLRVSTRRADAALRAFESAWAPESLSRARRALRKLRRAAAAVRDADVHMELLRGLGSGLRGQARSEAGALLKRLRAVRADQARALEATVDGHALPRVERAIAALQATAMPGSLADLARAVVAARASAALELATADLTGLPSLHALRIALKRLRYGIEVFADVLEPTVRRTTYPALERLQSRLGRLNDLALLLDRTRTDPRAAALSAELEAMVAREQAAAARAVRAGSFRDALARAGGGAAEAGVAAPQRTLAAIDVGSNAVRMRVERWDGARRILADERRTTRLGRGLGATGRLDPEAMDATGAVLGEFAGRARELGATEIAAVATAAVRDAANGSELVAIARKRAGLDLRVIGGDEEARLGLRAAAASLHPDPDQRLALVDVGGGSVEVVISIRGVIVALASMPLGAVRLTEAFGGPGPASRERFEEMAAAIESRLDEALGKGPVRAALKPHAVVGIGGTLTTLGFVQRRGAPRGPEPGLERITLASLTTLLERLRRTPIEQRAARFPGVPPDRADIIVAGLAVVRAVLQRLSAKACFVQEGGVREGLILAMGEGEHPGAPPRSFKQAVVLAGVRAFAERAACEQPHSAHVAAFSVRLFDRLRRLPRFRGALTGHRDSRLLLECAAHLHDAGCLVEYAAHHKHSQEMILHAELPGLHEDRRLVVAAVARYHRRSGPPESFKPGHEPCFALPPERQRQVGALAAVLRVADGLDRAHEQALIDVRAALKGKTLALTVTPAEGASAIAIDAGLAAALKKGDLLESVFGVRLTISAKR